MRILFLGAAGHHDKKNVVVEGEIDILCVPITGDGRYTAKQASEIVNNIEPKIVIPMGFTDKKDALLQTFIKEIGGDTQTDIQEKLTLKKKDLDNAKQKLYIVVS